MDERGGSAFGWRRRPRCCGRVSYRLRSPPLLCSSILERIGYQEKTRSWRDRFGPVRSVRRSGRCVVRELLDGGGNPAPGRRAVVITVGRELVSARRALLERLLTVALQHQIGGAPDIDLGYHAGKLQARGRETTNINSCMALNPACQGGGYMVAILTSEDVVRRIAAERAYVDERGGVGIRMPAAV